MSAAGINMAFTCVNILLGGVSTSMRFQDPSDPKKLRVSTAEDIGSNYFVNGTLGVIGGTYNNIITVPAGFNIIDTIFNLSGTTQFALSVPIGNSIAARYFIGNIQEVIVYTGPITDPQRQQVEQYLTWKWGLPPANLPTSHPGKLLPAFGTPFTPKSLTGMALWLDAADSSTITGTTSVTAWADKSGNGNNMSQISAGISYASNTVTFASGGILRSSGYTTITATQSVIYVVCQATAMTNGWCSVFACSDINGGDCSLRFYPNTTTIGDGFAGTTIYLNGTTTTLASGGTISVPAGYNVIGATPNGNGQSGSTRFSLSSPFAPGGNPRYFTGNIQEVIVYTGPTTAPQRQQVEGYLAWKWGLQSSLPSTHAYAKFSP